MQSIRSRIIISMIRNRHLFKLQWKKPVIDSHFSVNELRSSTEKAEALMNRKVEKSPSVMMNGNVSTFFT